MCGAHLSEVHEVLKAGVEVGLLLQRADVLEVGVVDVRIHPEEALEDGADDVLEGRREGLPVVLRENAGVVHLHTAICTLKHSMSSHCMMSHKAGRKGSSDLCRDMVGSYICMQRLGLGVLLSRAQAIAERLAETPMVVLARMLHRAAVGTPGTLSSRTAH